MKPFRKHVAVSVDGGGIKGVLAARALAVLEEHLGQPSHEVFRLVAGTSTGSIISAGIAAGLSADQIHGLYVEMGTSVLAQSWRTAIWPLVRYRYPLEPLESILREPISMDDTHKIPELTAYGEEMGRMILHDEMDRAMGVPIRRAPVP